MPELDHPPHKPGHAPKAGRSLRIGVWIAGLMLFLAGCALTPPTPEVPTLIPEAQLPTVIARTSEAIAAQTAAAMPTAGATLAPTATRTSRPAHTATRTPRPSATATASPSPVPSSTATPTATPTVTRTPTPEPPEEIPFAVVQIIQPAPLSKVVSPIELYAYLPPGDDGRVRVQLTGEDGRLLYREVFLFPDTPAGARVKLNAEITFGIIGVAETARLTVSIHDAYGRLKALSSVALVLLAEGQADINPAGDLLEEIVIQQPTVKSLIQGNSVLVSGLARTADDQPLLVELVAADGRVIGSRLASIAPAETPGAHRLFAAEVPFSVTSPTWVRVTVTDRSGRLPGPRHVSSVEVLLSP
jgi:hypothetical protein